MCFFIFFYICQKCSWALWLWSNGHASSVSLSEPGRSAGPSDEFRDTDYSSPSSPLRVCTLYPPKSSPGCPLSLLSSFHCTIIRHLPHFLVTTTFREVSIVMQYFVWTQLNDPKIGKDRYRVCQTKVTVEAKMITSKDASPPWDNLNIESHYC